MQTIRRFVLGVSVLAALSSPARAERSPANFFERLFAGKSARVLTDEEILAASSSGELKAKRIQVLVDNDGAFETKLAAIRSARRGETIRMVYYIYSDDHSSSLFWKEIVAAARRGVEVRILADMITNYKLMDLFAYLREAGRGRVQVRFFGALSPLIRRDANFLTRPCPPGPVKSATTCSRAKWKEIQENPGLDFYSKLLLSGALAKDATAAKVAVLEGQQIDLAKLQAGGGASEEEREQLVEFLKLVVQAKMKRDLAAGIKVSLGYALYGDKLNPVMNLINGALPLDQPGTKSFQDWEHLTDFTHHKLLMVEDRFLQLGGRNIENSYHMKPNPLIHRYVFKDVDAAIEISRGGQGAARAYDELWSFDPMVMSMDEILTVAPADFVMNARAAARASEECSKGSDYGSERRARVARCLAERLPKAKEFRALAQRIGEAAEKIEKSAREYADYRPRVTETWAGSRNLNGDLSEEDLKTAFVTYVENVHYDRSKPLSGRARIMGAKAGKERESGKYLHHLWIRGMENACATASAELKTNPRAPAKRVVLHSAYFLPPAVLVKTLGKMIDGTWDCRNVKVTVFSNSFETTDLNVINLLARYQMAAFYNVYARRAELFGSKAAGKSAEIEYHEIKKISAEATESMHAKVTVLGDDVLIGSANGDVRSYFMDTNNGLFIRRVPRFTRDYVAWIDGQIRDPSKTQSMARAFTGPGLTVEQNLARLHREDRALLEEFLNRRSFGQKVSRKNRERLHDTVKTLTEYIFNSTRQILAWQYLPDSGSSGDREHNAPNYEAEQQRIQERFDRLLQLL